MTSTENNLAGLIVKEASQKFDEMVEQERFLQPGAKNTEENLVKWARRSMASVLASALVILIVLLVAGQKPALYITMTLVIVNVAIITITVFLYGKDRNYRRLSEIIADGKFIFMTKAIESALSRYIYFGYKDCGSPRFFDKIMEITSGVFASDFRETSSCSKEEVEQIRNWLKRSLEKCLDKKN